MAKRKIIYDDDDDDDDVDDNANFTLVSKKPRRRTAKQVDTPPTDEPPSESTAARRSMRSGRGIGGRLAQMQELERIQTGPSTRPSKMDLATQAEDVNPMAPSFQDTSGASSRNIQRAAGVASHETREPPSASQPASQPVFARAAPGQQFGFRLPTSSVPETRAPPRKRFSAANSVTSSRMSTPAASLFSGQSLSGASTVPTSRASSVCSSTGRRTYSQVVQQQNIPQPARSSAPSSAHHRVSKLSSQSVLRSLDSEESDPEVEPEPPRSAVGLERTAPFYPPPSTNGGGYTHSATPRVDLEIDEISPSEDERIAEQVLRETDDSQRCGEYDEDINDASTQGWRDLPDANSRRRMQPSSADHQRVHAQSLSSRNTGVEDVVAAHRDRNHPPRLPSNTQLLAARHRQASSGSQAVTIARFAAQGNATPVSGQRVSELSESGGDTSRDNQLLATRHREASSGSQAVAIARSSAQGNATPVFGQRASPTESSGSRADKSRDSNNQVSTQAVARPVDGTMPPSHNNTSAASAPQRSKENTTAMSQPVSCNQPVGPATQGSDPWQLQYYDPPTRDIIERAKQFSHCDAASINAFPPRPNFNIKAIEYVDEAIAERRSRGLLISEGWWPQHSSSITRLLWEDLGNWRSALRKKARTWVAQRYQWDPENRHEQNVEIAKELLGGGGLFLRDGVDEEGHVNNLAHPALSGLLMDFFYTGTTSVGKLFPEVFESSVPRTTVALAATALKVALDEMISRQAEVSFKVNVYSPVYTEILGLMDKCDSSAIHSAKTKDLRERWARQASGGTIVEPGIVASGFDVDLG